MPGIFTLTPNIQIFCFIRLIIVMLLVMCNLTGHYKNFYIALALLQSLIACNPARAGEDPDKAYFQLVTATCLTCHSDDSRDEEAISALDDLSAARIKQLLIAYKTDQKQTTIMNRISKALTDEEIDRISAMFNQTAR